ncbi:MAG TPA: spore maturation protein [Firmicutes bacterium]|nr:spore maturation protein [Bacillota bacterium]
MLNLIWLAILTIGLMTAAVTDRWVQVTEAALQAARTGVELALGLVGVMALWLGLTRLMEASGLLQALVAVVRPFTRLVFTEIPPGDPAHGAIALNLLANLFGLGNAATPFGIQAMQRLAELEGRSGRASPAMCTLLVLNTAALTLVPAGVLAIRTAAGSRNPGEIIGPTIAATLLAQSVGLAADRFFRWRERGRRR